MQSDFSFRVMSLEFRLRDFFRPPERILREAGIRNGMTVLDFGCGPGGFSLAAAKLVGPDGRVYAVDNHPLARDNRSESRRPAGLRQHPDDPRRPPGRSSGRKRRHDPALRCSS